MAQKCNYGARINSRCYTSNNVIRGIYNYNGEADSLSRQAWAESEWQLHPDIQYLCGFNLQASRTLEMHSRGRPF